MPGYHVIAGRVVSTLTSLARAQAVAAGMAVPIATVRHVHLGDRPLVLVPLMLAGEANAPLAAMVGVHRDHPELLIVPQPRNRDQRFAFAAELAALVVAYLDDLRGAVETVPIDRGRDTRTRFADAPQILVPNPAGIGFLRLFGRSTRFRRTDGDYAVAPAVPVLGRWLTFLTERTEHPGSCLMLALTDAMALHWATGQSPVEDQNLAALIGWIDPPAGRRGPDAAAAAEDPLVWPPAGPSTDPTFDNEVLAALITAHQRSAEGSPTRQRALAALRRALAGQIEPTWRLMWQAIDLLRSLPAGQRVDQRWAEDRDSFTAYVAYLDDAGLPQPRRDGAVAAAQRLNWLERVQASYHTQRAFDDPLVMAEYRLTGEAFAGTVVAAEADRVDTAGTRRTLRPHITVATDDPVRLEPGTLLTSPTRPGQKATIQSIDGPLVRLELSGGMGRSLTPAPGSVPEINEWICYAALSDSYQPIGAFPAREETPWTHGGPPIEYVPADEDAHEEWS